MSPMREKEKLLAQHGELKKLDPSAEGFLEKLLDHFEEEEKFFERHAERLGGDDKLSPIGMVKGEHKLLVEYLKGGELEKFKHLLEYHLFKEETQIYPLLD